MSTDITIIELTAVVTEAVELFTTQRTSVEAVMSSTVQLPLIQIVTAMTNTQAALITRTGG
jgi:hypothetical protein